MLYPFKVYKSEYDKHEFWVAESTSLKGCVGQGDTIEEAYAELEENEQDWIETAKKYDIAVPSVPVENFSPMSGKFTVRISPMVHQEASEFAKKNGISLNQYVNDAIVSQNARISSVNYIAPEVKNLVSDISRITYGSSYSSYSRSNPLISLVRSSCQGLKAQLLDPILVGGN